MSFLTVNEFQPRLAAVLRVAPNDSSVDQNSVWQPIMIDALAAAYGEILERLRRRGWSREQIDGWLRGKEYQIDIALFWCLVKGAGLHGYDDKFIARLDRRGELDTANVVDQDGGKVQPLESDQIVGRGRLSDRNDRVVWDPDDPDRGEVTRW